MRFTDEMLRNFYRALERREPYELTDDENEALLNRLEKAEKVIQACGQDLNVTQPYNEWLVSKGQK